MRKHGVRRLSYASAVICQIPTIAVLPRRGLSVAVGCRRQGDRGVGHAARTMHRRTDTHQHVAHPGSPSGSPTRTQDSAYYMMIKLGALGSRCPFGYVRPGSGSLGGRRSEQISNSGLQFGNVERLVHDRIDAEVSPAHECLRGGEQNDRRHRMPVGVGMRM